MLYMLTVVYYLKIFNDLILSVIYVTIYQLFEVSKIFHEQIYTFIQQGNINLIKSGSNLYCYKIFIFLINAVL